MTLQNARFHIARQAPTHIGCFQAFYAIVDNFRHNLCIIEVEQSLLTSLIEYVTDKTNLYLVIFPTYAIDGKIKTSKVGTQ